MRKYFCDRCNKETTLYDLIHISFVNVHDEIIAEHEVCGKCYERMLAFITKSTKVDE